MTHEASGAMRTFERTFPIRLHDVDAAGIVFFARYFVLMHDAYELFLESLGHPMAPAIDGGRLLIPIAEAHCRYHEPTRHGASVTARLNIARLGRTSYTLKTRLVGADGRPRATITTRHVCVDTGTMRPAPLPPDLAGALREYLEPPGEDTGAAGG